MSNRLSNFLIPAIAVILGLLAGAIVMLISGYNPIAGYGALIEGAVGDSYYLGETLRQMTPYIFAGLAVAFAFRTGLFNIGVEGQLLVGWIAAVWVGISFELPKIIHLPLAIIAAGIAGAIWGFVPGFLKARLRVHEVIVTIMMNYIALHVTNYFTRHVLSDYRDSTPRVNETASLASPYFEQITEYSTLHYGVFIALFSALVMWFIVEKTKTGFELRSVGLNQHASEYAGMNVNRNIIASMMISGAFAGLAGAMEGLGTFGNAFIHTAFSGVGFDGIAVALLGSNTAIGVVLSAFLFGGLKIGALKMPIANVPEELVEIVIAFIIFFVASSYFIKWVIARFKRSVK